MSMYTGYLHYYTHNIYQYVFYIKDIYYNTYNIYQKGCIQEIYYNTYNI